MLLPPSVGFAQNFPAKALSFASHLIAALAGRHAVNNGMLTRRVCGVVPNPWLSETRSPVTLRPSPQRLTNYHEVSRVIIPVHVQKYT